MTCPSAATKSAKDAILEDGFVSYEDAQLGTCIELFNSQGIPFASAPGFQFCKSNVLDKEFVRHILADFFKYFRLGLYRSFGATPGDYSFKQSDPAGSVESLVVQLWSKGSTVTMWRGSHKMQLPSIKGENSLWRVPRANLKRLGLEPVDITFTEGGITITDLRTATEIKHGTAITFAFGTEEVVTKGWSPMRVYRTKEMEQTVSQMQTSEFTLNITYIELDNK